MQKGKMWGFVRFYDFLCNLTGRNHIKPAKQTKMNLQHFCDRYSGKNVIYCYLVNNGLTGNMLHQPEILIFNMWDPDTRWVGNESGVAHLENNNLVNSLDFSVQTDVKDILDGERFLPVECDCRIRLSNWFYSDSDAHTLKSIEELMGLYYYSVGRGANLLINIAPDREGKLPQKDAETFLAFGQEIKRRFSCPLKTEQIVHQDNRYLISFPQDTLVNHVVLKEDICQSEQVKQFQIKAYPFAYGDPIVVYEGHTIGHKVICQFPTIRTQKIELVIQKSSAPETIKSIELFYIS